MHQFKFGPVYRKHTLLNIGLAAMIAVPMFAQPLGLVMAPANPAAQASAVKAPALYAPEADRPETLADLGIELGRPANEASAESMQFEASRDVKLTLATPVTAVSAYTAYISGGSVNFRTGPSTANSVIDVLHLGAKLTVTGETTDWKRVKDAAGRTGYVSAKYVSRSMVFVSVSDTVYLLKSGVNLRQGPSTSTTILGVLSAGTRLTRTGIGDGWTRVTTAKGTVGYVASYFLTTNAPATTTSTSSGDVDFSRGDSIISPDIAKVVSTAESMLGVPYVFASEDRSGVDCSGLTYYCYKQIGITLPRTSASQAGYGTSIAYANLRPGDIIALDTKLSDGKTATNHVGLYVGGGNMIHASSSKGKVVKANVADYIKYAKITSIRRIIN